MTASATPGIRDRKRLETRARIEEAAVSLVLRDGLEAATVDAISELADISPRTFFNYFESKDGAILGVHQPSTGEDLMAEHVEAYDGQHLVESVIALLAAVMGGSLGSRASVHEDRLEIIRRHPEVLGAQLSALNARTGQLTETIGELLTRTPGFAAGADLTSYAEVLLATCGGAVRAAVREWAADRSHRSTDTIQQRAAALVTGIAGTLA